MASVLVEYLHGGDHEFIRSFLKSVGDTCASVEDLGLTHDDYAAAMRLAPTTRKNRYTILDEISLDDDNLKQIYHAVYGG